ncbi:MAG TPA: hypothetical protein VLM38_13260 [Blastocatellia bacterium]|nr:hypothetical protein [Blastocatellia bacterium]
MWQPAPKARAAVRDANHHLSLPGAEPISMSVIVRGGLCGETGIGGPQTSPDNQKKDRAKKH